MKKSVILVVVVILFVLIGLTSNDSTNNSDNKKFSKNNVKTYDVSSDKYVQYVEDVMFAISKTTNNFYLSAVQTRSPYVNVNFYEKNTMDEETFEIEKNRIIESVYAKLKQNKYESGGMFKTNYEFISIGFYKNYGNGDYRLFDFEQIDMYKF